jgi:hypothetical protein
LFIHGYRFTFKHLCWHSITKILRNGPRAHFPFRRSLGARSVGGDRRRASGVASSCGASASARQQGDRGRHGAATSGQLEENPDLPAPWRVGVRVHHRPRSGGAWAEEGGAAWRDAGGAWAQSLGARRSLGTRVPQRVCQRGGCIAEQRATDYVCFVREMKYQIMLAIGCVSVGN